MDGIISLLFRGRVILVSFWVFSLFVDLTFAEQVFVKSGTGQQGHAWLFGSAGKKPGECWLAVPTHVIVRVRDGIPTSFSFKDRSSVWGESELPIIVNDVPDAQSILGWKIDLAFARVKVGRKRGECLSRLGLPEYVYRNMLKSSPQLTILSLLPTSFGIFNATISRARIDNAGGALIEVRSKHQKDGDTYFKQGLSGAVAEVTRGRDTYPFGMILQVPPGKGVARALRFDVIQKAFDLVDRVRHEELDEQDEKIDVGFAILAFDANPLQEGLGPSSLKDPNSCWRIGRQGEHRSMSVTLEVNEFKKKIRGIAVVQKKGCGESPIRFFVDQRVSSSTSWSRAVTCKTVKSIESNSNCYLDLRGPRQLRISFYDQSEIGINAIQVN